MFSIMVIFSLCMLAFIIGVAVLHVTTLRQAETIAELQKENRALREKVDAAKRIVLRANLIKNMEETK